MSSPKNSHCILNSLPLDIIVYILQSPCLNVHEVMLFAEIWPQFFELSIYVLRYHQLPRLRIQSIMDQEGKRLHPTFFKFHSLDTDCLRATFVVQTGSRSGSKRFISNKATAAPPRLRQITLHHLSNTLLSNQSSLSTNSTFSYDSSIANIPSFHNYSQKETVAIDLQIQCERRSDNNSDTNSNMIRPHRLSLKEGIHVISTISSSNKHLQQIRSMGTSRPLLDEKWQYSYHVSCMDEPIDAGHILEGRKTTLITSKQKMEHMFVSPVSITVPLSIIRSSCITTPTTSSRSLWLKRYFNTAMRKIGLN